MKTKMVKQIHAYKVNLATTARDGSFKCPHCGARISPDDDTEASYAILETSVDGLGLDEVVIRCNMCRNSLHLTGFPPEPVDTDEPWFIAHV